MGWWSGLVESVRSTMSRQPSGLPVATPAGQLTTIDALVDRMRGIGAKLEPNDGLAAFNDMYLRVTELVRDKIAAGWFQDAERMTRLDIVFGSLYLAAVDAPAPNPAWAPVFECRRKPGRLRPVARCTPTASQAAVNVEPPAINPQNRGCLSISSCLDDMHNTSDQNGVATTN